jgi:hypothetical protein
MTDCLPLQVYGRKFLPSRCMHTRATTWELPSCRGRLSNCMGAHVTALLQRSGSFSNCIQALCSHLQWQDTKLHARGDCCPAAVAGYQTACARSCPAGCSVCFNASLSKGQANMQQKKQQQQQQQSKMYTRGALALAGKNRHIYYLGFYKR